MRLGWAGLALLFGMTGCVRWRPVERKLDSLGAATIPQALEPQGGEHTRQFGLFRFSRVHPWNMGSFTPYQARLSVIVYAADVTPAERDRALRHARDDVHRSAEQVKPLPAPDARWKIEEAVWNVNMRQDPCWILWHDRGDRAAALMVWKSDATLEEARRYLTAVLDSVRLHGEPKAWFESAPAEEP
jgi:hypothetical protein